MMGQHPTRTVGGALIAFTCLLARLLSRRPGHLAGVAVNVLVTVVLDFPDSLTNRNVCVMEESRYGLKVTVPMTYDTAVQRTTEALKAAGFGVLTTIDVQQTLRAKLNREFRKYVILGACNPALADRALHAEIDIGLLLPCNVIVYDAGTNETVIAAMAPLAALGLVGENAELKKVAGEADSRLRRALTTLEQGAVSTANA